MSLQRIDVKAKSRLRLIASVLPGLAFLIAVLLAQSKVTASEPAAEKTDSYDFNAVDIESSVVKVYVSANPPDLLSPWQKSGVTRSTGSGVVIDGTHVLTNAHVVEDAVSVEVKRSDLSERYVAEVAFINHACDLALLAVDDEFFFAGVQPTAIGQMPKAHTEVEAFGFPVGGDTISVTSGIISRIEVGSYTHSKERLLLAQIDAAINAGNSGGPVVSDGQLVGVAMQGLDDAENVGYMIPVSVVRHFLEDIRDRHVDGFPNLGVMSQELGGSALRESLGMLGSQTGAVVTWVDHDSPADGVLRPRDVLLQIEGLPIANDKTVAWPNVGRVHYSHAFKSRQIDESIRVRVLRDGKVLEKVITLGPLDRLVPGRRLYEAPQYFVFGGLLFQPLSADYFGCFDDAPPHDLADFYYYGNRVTRERQQIILIQKVLPNVVNRGYQSFEDHVVETVNGTIPRDMQHLVELIDGATEPFLEIVTKSKLLVTIRSAEARAARETILRNFGISHDRSPDLRSATSISAVQTSIPGLPLR